MKSEKQQYSVEYFSRKHRIPPVHAAELLALSGSSRDIANRLAAEFKASLTVPFRFDGRKLKKAGVTSPKTGTTRNLSSQ